MSTRSFLDEAGAASAAKRDPRHPGVAIREIACKSILNRSALSDYSLNCYTGCAHGCVYCYARFMQRFHPHAEEWGRFVDVKVNAVDVLKRQLRRAAPGTVFVSSACDGWQPIESDLRLTRRCCELLLERGFNLHVLTKSALVLRDLDLLRNRAVTLGGTLTTLDEEIRKEWEPNAASVAERLKVLAEARAAGIETTVMFGPLLPSFSDTEQAIADLLQCAADLKVGAIYVDALNKRPRVWPSVSTFLAKRHFDLLPQYRRILFNSGERAKYLRDLRARVRKSARRLRLERRLEICF